MMGEVLFAPFFLDIFSGRNQEEGIEIFNLEETKYERSGMLGKPGHSVPGKYKLEIRGSRYTDR